MNRNDFMREAIRLSVENVEKGLGGPFGAVIVKDGEILARGSNQVTTINDPTAHAEVVAIREACKIEGNFQLTDCQIYCSCEPCPMCFGAIYWARLDRIYFANTKQDAAKIGFDDQFIYEELELPIVDRSRKTEMLLRDEALSAFQLWDVNADKVDY